MQQKRVTSKSGIHIVRYCQTTKPKQTLIFSSGLGGGALAWEPIIELVLQALPNAECIAYDLRCHGASECSLPKSANDLYEVLSEDLVDVIETIRSPYPVVLIGHSIGGFVVQEACNRHKELRPLKKILINSSTRTPLAWLGRPKLWYTITRLLSQKKIAGAEKSTKDFFAYAHTWDFDLKRIMSDIRYISLPIFLGFWLNILSYKNAHPTLIDAKNTLFLYGKDDLILPRSHQEKVITEIREVQAFPIDSNHVGVLNAVEEIAQRIVEFLQS